MKVYAMLVRLSTNDLNGGWRFEGFTMNEHSVQKFIHDVNEDIEKSRSETVLVKTLEYKIVELDF